MMPGQPVDITPGDATHMAQVFPAGTGDQHWEKQCWCKPSFQFTLIPGVGSLGGAVIHR